MPSVQVGAEQVWEVVLQTFDVQSAGTRHPLPSAHGWHDPPQSTSVSLPSLTPSLHVGALHT